MSAQADISLWLRIYSPLCIKFRPMPTKSLALFLFVVRLCVGAVWMHEGLWQKIVRPDAHELDIVSYFSFFGFGGATLMMFIGGLETLLALGFWSGLLPRLCAWTGVIALLAMNLVGIIGSDGTIADPMGLLIHNLPLWCCMLAIALWGAGRWTLAPLFAARSGS